MWHQKQRKVNYVPHKSSSSLCPNCLSEMIFQDSKYVCSGNRFSVWKTEIEKFKQLSEAEQLNYLNNIANPSKFLEMIDNISTFECSTSNRMNNTIPSQSTRIPDPIAQNKLEKALNRKLTDQEMEEGFIFEVNGKRLTLPFINFPDDI